jgi:uncharacterized protein (TIRG00374 family)
MESAPEQPTPTTDESPSRTTRILIFAGRALVAAVVLYFVLQLVSLHQIVLALHKASVPYILAGASLLVLNIAVRVMKWRSMLHIVIDESSWWESFTSIMLGITLGSFTPVQLGELGGRSIRVNHSKRSHVVGLTLVDRSQVFLVVAMAGTFSYAFFLTDSTVLAVLAGSICAAIILYLYFRLDLVKSVADRIHLRILRHQWIEGIIETFTFIGKEHFLSTLIYSLVWLAIVTLQMYFILSAFVPISLWHVFLGFSAMMFFKSIVNISISDIGIREASTIYFFSLFGVPDAAALSASVVMFAINIIIPSLIGIMFVPKFRRAGTMMNGTTTSATNVPPSPLH